MDDDFNSAQALGHLFDLARDVNRALDEGAGPKGGQPPGSCSGLGGILGLFWRPPAEESWIPRSWPWSSSAGSP
jgi:hypothetical protein